jgi:K+-sensing histidine kinase KdpD
MKQVHASLALASIERLHGSELARISHALKTPLTSIIGFTSAILSDPTMDRETCIEFARIIKSEGERLSRFVEELLYISFIDADASPSKQQITQPSTLMRTAVRVVSANLDQPQTRFNTLVSGLESPIEVDREFILKMLVNVLSNAAKFSVQGARISVSGRVQGDLLVYQVSSFRRGRNLDLRSAPGSFSLADTEALGLARTKHMLALRGGTLSVFSNPGEQTTVEVAFPLPSPSDSLEPHYE